MNSKFYERLLSVAACFGIMGVSFGAFGAHFLKTRLSAGEIDVVRTGVLYLFIHTVVILVIVLLGKNDPLSRVLKSAGIFLTVGIILFSGSLFLIATQTLTGFPAKYVGILTPIGGLFFIAGWLMLFISSVSGRK